MFEARLFDFFGGETVIGGVGVGSADEVEEGGGGGLKDAVEKAIGFQGFGVDGFRLRMNSRMTSDCFQPAYQLGLTATPQRDDNVDTYRYFGNPLYTYSLAQGIEDGFLAPYKVHRVTTTFDALGWRPNADELDRL